MAWSIIGYNMQSAAPIQDTAALTPSTPGQKAGQAAWIVATVTSDVTLTLSSGNTLHVPLSAGLTIVPAAVTNFVLNSGTVTVSNVFTTS